MDFDSQLKQLIEEVDRELKGLEMSPGPRALIEKLLIGVERAGEEVRASRSNTNDFSGDVRIFKARAKAAQQEAKELDNFVSSLVALISEKVKVISVETAAILNSEATSEEGKKSAEVILGEIRDMVTKIANKDKAS